VKINQQTSSITRNVNSSKSFCFQYDLSASQFSPDGRVFQIEYAAKAAEISGTAIGLRGKDGCVLAVEKIINSKLHEPDSGRRIFTIENSIGLVNKNFVEVSDRQ
jgi:20S proteasome alpha/beta subunit